MSSIKVLQVNKLYAPHTGGVEKVVQDIAEGLKDKVDMKVLVCQTKGRTTVDIINGVEITRAGSVGMFSSMPISFSFFSYLRKLSKDCDILHFHMPFPLGDAAYFLSGFKGKVVVWWHSDIVRQKALMKIYKPLMNKFLQRADCIIVATEGHINGSKYLSPYRKKCVVIPFGIDTHAISDTTVQSSSSISRDLPQSESEIQAVHSSIKKILFIGRLIYYKGVSVLLDAFKNIQGAQLYIAGDGTLKEHLMKQAQDLGVSDNVFFLGKVSDEKIRELLNDCNFLVLPSIANSEAFGLVQIEAMACSKPVINTLLPTGVPYVSLHEQTGLTVPPGDAAALHIAMQRLIDNDNERMQMGIRAKARVLEYFTMKGMLDSVYELYKKLL